jgi:putative ABC transport system permease protein
VAIVSDRLWHEVFHGCEEALGRTVTLDGVAYRVIGVVAGKLAFPVRSDELSYWTTVAVDAEPSVWGGSVRKSRGYPRYDAALARLKSGVTMAQARAEMTAIAGNVARLHPGMDLKDGVQLSAALEDVVGKTKPLLWKLYGAVFCVLLVACANAATLLLVGAVARCREFALRAALGAGRSRLVRQLLAESMVIALGGGVGGAALAWGLVSAFARIAPPDTPRLNMVHADGATLLYALALSVATGLVFGMAPAWAALRRDLADTLKEGARTFGRGRSGLSPGTVLIVGQIALSMTLGCSAAALTGGFWRILHTPRGFDPQDVLTASISLPPTRYPQGSAKVLEFYTELVDRMRRVHGVVGVSVAQSLPLSGQNNSTKVEVAGGPETNGASTDLRFVDTSYFQTLRIPLLQGRNLDAGDVPGRAAVVVVNRAFAARFLGWRNAVGARLTLGWGGNAPKEVVGVVGDIRHNALSAEAAPEVYVPLAQFPINDLALVMRTRASAGGVAATLREYVRRLDAGVPVEDVRTLEEYLLRSAATQRLLMWLLVAFAGSALLLAAIGLYGALGYSTACRQHEFGVRMALGSNGWGVMRLVLREGLSIALVGMLGGLALTEWLNGIGPLDGLSLTCSGTVLLGVAAVACWVPARRATRVDPLRSLRGE